MTERFFPISFQVVKTQKKTSSSLLCPIFTSPGIYEFKAVFRTKAVSSLTVKAFTKARNQSWARAG